MLELVCQGASFSVIPAANPPRRRSPCAELWLDGQKLGRTQRHDRGDKQPRWEDRFPVSASGRRLDFRVFVGNAPDEQLCGEGVTDLQAVITRGQPGPSSVQLSLNGESIGVLWFVFGPLRNSAPQAAQQIPLQVPQGPPPAMAHQAQMVGQPGGGYPNAAPNQVPHSSPRLPPNPLRQNSQPTDVPPRCKSPVEATYATMRAEADLLEARRASGRATPPEEQVPQARELGQPVQPGGLPRASSQPRVEDPGHLGGLPRASSQPRVEDPGYLGGLPRASSQPRVEDPGYLGGLPQAGPGFNQFAVPAAMQHGGWPHGGEHGQHVQPGGVAPANLPPQVIPAAMHNQYGAEPFRQPPHGGGHQQAHQRADDKHNPVPERTPVALDQGRGLAAPAGNGPRSPFPPPPGEVGTTQPEADQLTPKGRQARDKSPRRSGGFSPRFMQRKSSHQDTASATSASSGKTRLNIGDKGKHQIEELMSSKDKMREFASRPYKQKQSLDATLDFDEFQDALRGMLQLCEISMPGEQQVKALFAKHQSNGKGVSVDEFEALLFRLLCFMRASQEVSPSARPSTHSAKGGEERDKRWREEFIQKNPHKFEEVYDRVKELGKGSFGTVWKVVHKTHRNKQSERCVRVCKIIGKAMAHKAGTSHTKVREELAVLKQLDHPHVLRIFEDFEDDTNFYLIMEPCWGGDLQDYVRNLPPMDAKEYEFWVAKVMQHTLAAIGYCHSKGVIHKDLKPENVMMSTDRHVPVAEMHIVVVDFGLSEVFSDKEQSNIVSGTPPYMAPEVWAGQTNRSCDIWSCGVMLFFLLSGRLPFVAQRLEDFRKAVALEPDWAMMGGATQEAQEFCKKMLEKQWQRRITAQDALKDRWFVSVGLGGPLNGGPSKLPKSHLNALLKVGERTEFEKFVSRLVATQVDASQQKQVNETFRNFDTDGDGLLSRDELRRGLMELAGHSRDKVDQIMDELDVGHTGRISYTEFLAGVIDLRGRKSEDQDKLLWIAWQQFSPDEQGRVKTQNVLQALSARGMTVDDLPEKFLEEMQKGGKASDYSDALTFESFKKLLASDSSDRLGSFVERFTGKKIGERFKNLFKK